MLVLGALGWNLLFPLVASAQDSGSFTARNGFTIAIASNGTARVQDGAPDTTTVLTSASGETMNVRLISTVTDEKKNKATLTAVLDGQTTIIYDLDQGVVKHVTVVTSSGYASADAIPADASSSYVPTSAQEAVYEMMHAALVAHSADFRQQLSDALAAYTAAGNSNSRISKTNCGLAIAGYLLSFLGFVACPTLVGCFLAVVAHWIAIASAVCSCTPLQCP